MWLGWLVNTLWFVSLAKTGWPRHFWFGLVLAVMLLCVTVVTLIRLGLWGRRPDSGPEGEPGSKPALRWPALAAALLLIALIGWGFASQPYVRNVFLPDEIVPYWREKRLNFKYGASLPSMIIPRAAQAEVINYIKDMPPEANVYYPDGHKTADSRPKPAAFITRCCGATTRASSPIRPTWSSFPLPLFRPGKIPSRDRTC